MDLVLFYILKLIVNMHFIAGAYKKNQEGSKKELPEQSLVLKDYCSKIVGHSLLIYEISSNQSLLKQSISLLFDLCTIFKGKLPQIN